MFARNPLLLPRVRTQTTRPTRPTHARQSLIETLEIRCLLSTIPLPTIPAGTYNITSYGAKGDGSTDNTTAIQNAINAAHNSSAAGGTVLIPFGTFLSNKLTLYSSIDLQLASGATLQDATPSATLLVAASSSHDIAITGSGTIDGHATATSSNNLVSLQHVTTLEISGVTIANSSHEHLVIEADTNVTVDTVTINDNYSIAQTGGYLKNTDAIDFSGSHFLIQNCNINAGDDDIVAKPESTFCSDITITHDTIGRGHGISIGGQTNAGLDGMFVSYITMNGTDNGLRLKAGRGNGGLVQNVSFDHITITNVKHPLYITSYYLNGGDTSPSNPASDPGQTLTSTTPVWQNITFSNVTATGAGDGGIIYAVPEAPIQNLTLTNVSITGSSKPMEIYHAHNVLINPAITPAPTTYDVTYASTTGSTVIVDNKQATLTGTWTSSTGYPGFYGTDYDYAAANSGAAAKFTPNLTAAGTYEVYARWITNGNRATNVPFDITSTTGTKTVTENEQSNNAAWVPLGAFDFAAGTAGNVTIRTTGANGYVIADAVEFVPVTPVIVDNAQATLAGAWTSSTGYPGFYGTDYDYAAANTSATAKFSPNLSTAGTYQVYARWVAGTNRATNAPFDIVHQGTTSTVLENEQSNNGAWVLLGTYSFDTGTGGSVTLRANSANGYVIADAVRFVKV